jgi:hypothetical protein
MTSLPKLPKMSEVFRVFPLGHKIIKVAVVLFLIFNVGSWIGFTTDRPLYADWLETSQPITYAVAEIIPAVDMATTFLDTPRRSGLYASWIPSIRNLLSINFALFFLFPVCFGIAAYADVITSREHVGAEIEAFSLRTKASINSLFWRCVGFPVVFLPLAYFGIATRPWLISYGKNVVGYIILFGIFQLFLLQAICYFIFSIILKSKRLQIVAPRDEPTNI